MSEAVDCDVSVEVSGHVWTFNAACCTQLPTATKQTAGKKRQHSDEDSSSDDTDDDDEEEEEQHTICTPCVNFEISLRLFTRFVFLQFCFRRCWLWIAMDVWFLFVSHQQLVLISKDTCGTLLQTPGDCGQCKSA